MTIKAGKIMYYQFGLEDKEVPVLILKVEKSPNSTMKFDVTCLMPRGDINTYHYDKEEYWHDYK